MSTSAQKPGQGQAAHGKLDKRTKREITRTASLVVLSVLVTLFALFNLNEVKVSFVFGSTHAPLIIVIIVSVLFGIVLTYLAERLLQRRSRR